MLGILLTGVFAAESFGGLGLPEGVTIAQQVGVQALGVVVTLAWSGVISIVLLLAIKAFVGLRVPDEEEIEGLDLTTHGERSHTV
jgi:Amt family ammonium transporter